MTTKETISTWKWRIIKAGYSQKTFCEMLGITEGALSQYMNERKKPTLDTFDKIEAKLIELGV